MTAQSPPAAPHTSEPWTAFAAWAADELGMQLACVGDVYRAEAELYEIDPEQVKKNARKSWLLRRVKKAGGAENEPSPIEADSPSGLVTALCERLLEREHPAHLKPVQQPEAVHEITAGLFDAYTLDGGKAHVAGCLLEDAPFVRLSVVQEQESASPRVVHAFWDTRGVAVDPSTVDALGLDRAVPYGEHPPKLAGDAYVSLLALARSSVVDAFGVSGDTPCGVAVVWAKRATGRLSFEFGEETVEAVFNDWARLLAPPPVRCPVTGRETFHLCTVEGGAIVAAEEAAVSDVTGLRRVRSEMLRCAESGKLAEAEWFATSEISQKTALLDELAECQRCGLMVVDSERSGSGCRVCGAAERVGAESEPLATILRERPELARQRWRLAEAPHAYVLVGDDWLSQRVATVDKESLALRRYAKRSRFSSVWRPVQTRP